MPDPILRLHLSIPHLFERSIPIIRGRVTCRADRSRTSTGQRDIAWISPKPIEESRRDQKRPDGQDTDDGDAAVAAGADGAIRIDRTIFVVARHSR